MKKFIALGLTLIAFTASAQFSDIGRQELKQINLLKNPGFEAGLAGWSGDGTISLNTSGTSLYEGVASLAWSATAAQAIISEAVTMPRGSDSTCKAWAYYKQDGSNVTFRVLQSGSPVASTQLAGETSGVQFRRTPVLEFPCDNNALNIQLLATGTVSNFAIDQIFMGVSDPDFTDNFTQNYVKDGTFENVGVHGWLTYDDTALIHPVDGTGGTASTLSFFDRRFGEGNVARDNGSFLWQKSAADGQGEGVGYAFTIEEADTTPQRMRTEFEYMTNTNYVAGDVGVYIYDVDGAALVKATGVDLPKTASTSIARKFSFEWDATASDDYRLIFHIKTTNAGSYFVSMDSVKISPVTKKEQAPATGEVNYLENPDVNSATFEVSAGYWSTFDDGAVSTPVDGTGGTASQVTFAKGSTAASLLRSGGYGQISKAAADGQGEGISMPFDIDNGEPNARMVKVEMLYRTSANYANSDLGVWVYCDLNGTPFFQPVKAGDDGTNTNIMFQTGGAAGVFVGTFFTPDDETDYDCRLIFMTRTTSALAWTVEIDDIVVGPGRTLAGAVVTSWTSFTPTGSFTTNTTYPDSFWRRVGENIEAQGRIAFGGVPNTTTLTINWLPNSLQVSSSVVSNSGDVAFGYAGIRDSGTRSYPGVTKYNSATTLTIAHPETTGNTQSVVDEDSPFAFNSADSINWYATAPISGWEGLGTMNALTQDNLSDWSAAYTPGEVGNWTTSARTAKYRQVGSDIEIAATAVVATASGVFVWSPTSLLPPGTTLDESKLEASSGYDRQTLGTAVIIDTGAQQYAAVVDYDISSNTFFVMGPNGQIASALTTPFTWAAGDIIKITIQVPVVELDKAQPSLVGFAEAGVDSAGLVNPYNSLGVIHSGEWTPTFTLTNATGTPAGFAHYVRVGKIVHVAGAIYPFTVTTTGSDVNVRITNTPVATGNFTTADQAFGVASLTRSASGDKDAGSCFSVASSDDIDILFENTTVDSAGSNTVLYFNYTYEIQ